MTDKRCTCVTPIPGAHDVDCELQTRLTVGEPEGRDAPSPTRCPICGTMCERMKVYRCGRCGMASTYCQCAERRVETLRPVRGSSQAGSAPSEDAIDEALNALDGTDGPESFPTDSHSGDVALVRAALKAAYAVDRGASSPSSGEPLDVTEKLAPFDAAMAEWRAKGHSDAWLYLKCRGIFGGSSGEGREPE